MRDLVPCDMTSTLIVDDEPTVLKVFKRTISFEMPELHLDLARNGLEALRLFEKAHYGVLIMDLHMPVMSGQNACVAIENLCIDKGWAQPSFVFCTGFKPSERFKRDHIDSIARNRLLIKPVGGSVIVDAVRAGMAA